MEYDCSAGNLSRQGVGHPWQLAVISVVRCPENPAIDRATFANITAEFCSPNSDLVGIGVLLSFIIGSAFCAFCALAVAALDLILSKHVVVPDVTQKRIQDRLANPNKRSIERWRTILAAVLLSLGDQQLVTGLGLGISFYVGLAAEADEAWPRPVILPEALLAVYIAALSSSSHMACLTSLGRRYLGNPVAIYIRLVLVFCYNIMFIDGIIRSAAFGEPVHRNLYSHQSTYLTVITPPLAWRLLPSMFVVYLYFLVVLQIVPRAQDGFELRIRYVLNAIERGTTQITRLILSTLSSLVQTSKRKQETEVSLRLTKEYSASGKRPHRISRLVEDAAWTVVLGSPGYNLFLQQASFAVALVFAVAQKWAPLPAPPRHQLGDDGLGEWIAYCVLTGRSIDNLINFGQLLPLILLALPLLTFVETFLNTGKELERELAKESGKVGARKLNLSTIPTDNAPARHDESVSAIQQRSLEEQL